MDSFNKSEQIAMEILTSAVSKKFYGLELVTLSENALKRGTVYITLSRLEDRGFLESENETAPKGTIPRRVYKVTGAGQRSYTAWRSGQAKQQEVFANWPNDGGLNHA
jgi:DNA-binding PadR family transcriptional regulator